MLSRVSPLTRGRELKPQRLPVYTLLKMSPLTRGRELKPQRLPVYTLLKMSPLTRGRELKPTAPRSRGQQNLVAPYAGA